MKLPTEKTGKRSGLAWFEPHWPVRAALLVLAVGACGRETGPAAAGPVEVRPATSAALPPPPPVGTVSSLPAPPRVDPARYEWWAAEGGATYEPLSFRIAPPSGARRVAIGADSFGSYLRHLPLAPSGTAVMAHDGRRLRAATDPRILAVVDLDLVQGDLQQCVDSIIRLHAEYLRHVDRQEEIAYRYTNGFRSRYRDWRRGLRPRVVDARQVSVLKRAAPSDSRATFIAYLRDVMAYAGTVSVARDAESVDGDDVRAGDFFVLGGGPGHAILILDVAEGEGGERWALLGQGFMPAQSFHVLRGEHPSGWFRLDPTAPLVTPFWPDPFPWSSLRRLKP